ncbi:MAG: polymerase [Patescibacteria group bacterium]|jgi:DNA polymerase-1|nr:polymerase [Patescibacteria group bacterium]
MVKENKKRIVLLDTHAIIHRAYHALPDFATSAGEPTGALYGLFTMILSILSNLKPDYIIACYDMPGGTFRSEQAATYKANRKKGDDELIDQIQKSREIMDALSIPYYEMKGYEADDLLGTLAEVLKKDKENEIIIASGDMDTLQLVDKKQVQVFTLKRGLTDTILYDEKAVKERFGFGPKMLPDYKGLRGDPSDNIIGIAGIGEKTATTLLVTFGTIEDIYKKLKKDKDSFKKAGITDRIIKLLEEGEEEALFSKTLATIMRDVPVKFSLPEKAWRENVEFENVEKVCQKYEFKSLPGRFKKEVLGEVEIKKEESDIKKEQNIKDEDVKKVAIAMWLIDSEKTNASLEDILSFAKTNNFEEAKKVIWKEVKKRDLEKVYEEIEAPIIPIVQKMHERGVLLDKKYLENLSKEYHKMLDVLEKDIYALAKEEFNIKSPKQLSEILFTKMLLPTKGIKKSASGGYSTDIGTLEKLEDEHAIIKKIIDYRELQKLLSTYIDVLPELVKEDGRLHAEFLQHGTSTGRFSSNNPNLQNIPTKSDLGRAIRNAFLAEKGYKLISFDYSQIELRIAAMFSGDEYMIKAFNEGKDIHSAVAMKVFDVKEDGVTSDMRRVAKVINFGILYGMGVLALKKNIGTSKEEAQKFYDEYFEQFKSIKDYLDDTKNFVRKFGYTETLFKRRRYFPGINSSLPFMRAMAERMAINAPIQGTSADIIKIAMRLVDEKIKEEGLSDNVFPILQIHDELIYEVKKDIAEKVAEMVKEVMEHVLENSFIKYKPEVPLSVNYVIGDNWGELK